MIGVTESGKYLAPGDFVNLTYGQRREAQVIAIKSDGDYLNGEMALLHFEDSEHIMPIATERLRYNRQIKAPEEGE